MQTQNDSRADARRIMRITLPLALCALAVIMLVVTAGCATVSASSKANTNAANFKYKSLFDANVGSNVTFGSYEQDGNASNGKEPIEWIVLQKQGSRVQLVSKDLLDYQPYRSDNNLSTWMESTLRPWLNSAFLSDAFSNEEREIVRKQVATYPQGTYHCNVTQADEMEFDYVQVPYSSSTASAAGSAAEPSAYAKSLAGASAKEDWWLSETGFEHTPVVDGPGVANEQPPAGGRAANSPNYVRPIIWISLPAAYVDGADGEGRYGVYAELLEYAPDARYLVDDIDSDGGMELVMLAKDSRGAYSINVYGYGTGELIYYGSFDCGEPPARFASLPGENGLLVYVGGSECQLVRLSIDNGEISQNVIATSPYVGGLPDPTSQSTSAQMITTTECSDTSALSAVLASSGPTTGFVNLGSNANTGSASTNSSSHPQSYDSTTINFDSTETRHDLNLFLSNFSEKGPDFEYTPEACTDGYMCNFAIEHIKYNFPEAMEDASGEGVRNSGGTQCNTRTSFEIFQRYPTVFLKHDFSEGNVAGQCVYQNGYVYYPHPADTAPSGIVYVTGTRDRADGKVDVAFDVYGGAIDYTVTDESYYTCSAEELMSRLGVNGPSRSGTAVVEPWDDGSVAPFKLYEFHQGS